MENITTKEKIEKLEYKISRFDGFYENVNNKGNTFLTINTIIIAGIAAFLGSDITLCWYMKVLVLLISISGILSITFTLLAILPYRKTNSKSMLFYGSIAKQSETQFKIAFDTTSHNTDLEDKISQAYVLAVGLDRKFRKLTIAGILIGFELLFGIILIILNSLN